ncbi:MAG: YfhO family protein [Syntrophobacteraceae bacterium]
MNNTGLIRSRIYLIEFSALLLLVIGMFWDVLFFPGDVVLSNRGTDLSLQFLQWRHFGFNELAHGNLALWNPCVFGGAPYFAGFQSALLYPFNWLFMVLPLAQAANVSIALHVLLGGMFFYLWAHYRGIHHLACFLAAVEFMFCAPHFLHIYAGHLANLCTMVWAPLLFLAIDRIHAESSPRWIFPGVFAVSMQILGGHIQYAFYTGIAASFYAGLLMIKEERRLRFCMLFSAIYLGAVLLCAVQLLPGIQAAAECVRGKGVSFEFASSFSFPPENLVTWLVPGFFGNMAEYPYWGRCYLWEMSLFFSVTGFALAIYAVAMGRGKSRIQLSIMVILLMLLSFGSHMPWFPVLYEYVPGFDKFRSASKFVFPATTFLIMLSAVGMNTILRDGFKRYKLFVTAAIALGLTAILAGGGIVSWGPLREVWAHIMTAMSQTRESYLSNDFYQDSQNIKSAAQFAARGLYIFAASCGLLALFAAIAARKSKLAFLLVILSMAELLLFARISRDTFHSSEVMPKRVADFLSEAPRDARILISPWPNAGMLYGAEGIWGFDPYVIRRYAEFVALTQGFNPDKVTQYMSFRQIHPLFDLMRCKYAVVADRNGAGVHQLLQTTMPRATLISSWIVIGSREKMFAALDSSSFNPRETVLIENDPGIPMENAALKNSEVRILNRSTDYLIIEAETSAPAILLITDAYSKGWHAHALEGSSQARYRVIPADYAFRGIPLEPGKHRIRLEYMPDEFRIGRIISLVSLGIFTVGLAAVVRPFAFTKRNRPLPSAR